MRVRKRFVFKDAGCLRVILDVIAGKLQVELVICIEPQPGQLPEALKEMWT